MRLLSDIWALLDSGQKRSLLLLQAATLLMAVSTLAGIAAILPFFAALSDPSGMDRPGTMSWLYRHFGSTSHQDFLIEAGIAFVALVLAANAINLAGSLAMNRFAHRIGNQFCVALFDEYAHREHLFHMTTNSATLFNNIVWEVSRGVTGVLQSLFVLSTNAVAVLLIMLSVVLINPLIALGAVFGLSGSYALIYLFSRRRLMKNGILESVHTEERTKVVAETLGAIREIIVLRGQAHFREKFHLSCESISRAAINTHAIAQSPKHILECIVVGGLVGTAVLLIDRGGQGHFWLAQLSFLGLAAYRLLPALQQMFHAVVKIRGDRVAFYRIADDLRCARRAAAESRHTRSLQPDRTWPERPHRQIQLTQVHFRYSLDRQAAIRNVTLSIPAGATVGLVGPSGSGKTTLAELIVGLPTPTSGSVSVDGITLNETNRADWHSAIGYVPQQNFLFDASLAENVALATAIDDIDRNRLADALHRAQLTDLVASLPRGTAELLGERGVKLSGGQRQRIGIARALYRRTSVLIFDEATNALDGMTESEVMAMLDCLRGTHTIILIAHRLRSVRSCDLIFELENGRLAASGTFHELLQHSSGFRSLLHGAGAPSAAP
jgi:ATP-binding cassette, subfamily B, bacterial PglK